MTKTADAGVLQNILILSWCPLIQNNQFLSKSLYSRWSIVLKNIIRGIIYMHEEPVLISIYDY